MRRVVMDASAVLALLRGEPGGEIVQRALGGAVISAVNLQEVYCKLLEDNVPTDVARDMVEGLRLEVRAHDAAAALASALLAPLTRKAGSGLGDRTCMALAIEERAPALTSDRSWTKVEAPGLKVELIR